MDAIEFVKMRRKMFSILGENPKCSLFNIWTPAEDVVKEVEEWTAAHPTKTKQSVFLEQYPNAALDGYGILSVSPCDIDSTLYDYSNCDVDDCSNCRYNFWTQGVENEV